MKRDLDRWRATQRKGALNWLANAKPRRPLRAVSKRRARENRERAVIRKEREGTRCAAGLPCCIGEIEHLHEVLTRGRGGDPTDRENILAICAPCHDWIHGHPREAHELGLLKHSWEAA